MRPRGTGPGSRLTAMRSSPGNACRVARHIVPGSESQSPDIKRESDSPYGHHDRSFMFIIIFFQNNTLLKIQAE